MIMLTVENGKVAPRAALCSAPFLDLVSEIRSFSFLVSPGNDLDQRRRDRFPFLSSFFLAMGLQRRSLEGDCLLRKHRRVLIHDRKSTPQNGRERAAIVLEHNQLRFRHRLREKSEGLARSAAKTVNSLI